MRTVVRVCFDASGVPGGPQAILDPAHFGPDVVRLHDVPVLRRLDVWVTLEATDPRVTALFQLLKQHAITWLVWSEDCYTEEEIDHARLLLMHSNRQCEIDGGVKWGTTYDLSEACPACCTGGRQTSAMFVDGEQISELNGHRAGATYHEHPLLDDGLAAELERVGATGLSLHNVYAVMADKRQVKLRWKQLSAARTLPPMSPRTTGLTRNKACEVCRRNGFFRTSEAPTRIVYRASDLRDADDINLTWENMWMAFPKPELRDSVLSQPWTVVTPKVRRVFRDAGVTSFDWLPIRVEDE
jgi:hypothetical protein